MSITRERLSTKITDIYPELDSDVTALEVGPDDAAGDGPDWLVTMRMGGEALSTRIDGADAADCVEGGQCLRLGVQVGRFVQNYCLARSACPV